jgi:hypothetical protein
MPFTNGDFETGDFTGWTSTGWGGGVVSVTAGSKKTGTYGCNITVTTTDNEEGVGSISQSIATTFDAISLCYKVAAYDDPPTPSIKILVTMMVHDGSDVEQEIYVKIVNISATSDWVTLSITKAECEAGFEAGYHWNESGYTTITIGYAVLSS